MQVAIRELKAGLSRILSRAQAGEVIEVTSHNKSIARIVGIPPTAGAGLRGLIAAARTLQQAANEELHFACFDTRLEKSAKVLGMLTLA